MRKFSNKTKQTMKRKILSLAAMVLTTITGNAQSQAFKSLTVEA